jgi:hypothetical protein
MRSRTIIKKNSDYIDSFLEKINIQNKANFSKLSKSDLTTQISVFFACEAAFKKILKKHKNEEFDFKILLLIFSRVRFFVKDKIKKIMGAKAYSKFAYDKMIELFENDNKTWINASNKEKYLFALQYIYILDLNDNIYSNYMIDVYSYLGTTLLIDLYKKEMSINI